MESREWGLDTYGRQATQIKTEHSTFNAQLSTFKDNAKGEFGNWKLGVGHWKFIIGLKWGESEQVVLTRKSDNFKSGCDILCPPSSPLHRLPSLVHRIIQAGVKSGDLVLPKHNIAEHLYPG
jgi:hypothetical protein